MRSHFCRKCDNDVNQEIRIDLGLSSHGKYTNNYCLNCDARMREDDFKEIKTDFNCPGCNSFLNSGYVKICSGCGEFLSWISLDRKMFKLPKEEFKKEILDILIPLTQIKEPKNKHEVEIKEFKCPFCDHKETIKVREQIWNDSTKGWSTVGVDYWECQECGEENDIGLESFEKNFKAFKKYTEKNDWEGLRIFCASKKFDEFMLYNLAKYYMQKQEFQKSLEVLKILVENDPNDILSEELIEKSKRGMEIVKAKNENI